MGNSILVLLTHMEKSIRKKRIELFMDIGNYEQNMNLLSIILASSTDLARMPGTSSELTSGMRPYLETRP